MSTRFVSFIVIVHNFQCLKMPACTVCKKACRTLRGLALHYDRSTFCDRSRDMTVSQRGTRWYSDVQNTPKDSEETLAMDCSDDEDDVAGFPLNNDDDDANALEESTEGLPTTMVHVLKAGADTAETLNQLEAQLSKAQLSLA